MTVVTPVTLRSIILDTKLTTDMIPIKSQGNSNSNKISKLTVLLYDKVQCSGYITSYIILYRGDLKSCHSCEYKLCIRGIHSSVIALIVLNDIQRIV